MLSARLILLLTAWLVLVATNTASANDEAIRIRGDPGETGFTFCDRPNLTGWCKYTSRYDKKFSKVWEAGVPNGSFSLVANPGTQCTLSENAAVAGAQKVAHYR